MSGAATGKPASAGVLLGKQNRPPWSSPLRSSMTERDALRALRAIRAEVFETHRRAFRFWREAGQPEKAATQRRLAEQARAEVASYDRQIRDRSDVEDAY